MSPKAPLPPRQSPLFEERISDGGALTIHVDLSPYDHADLLGPAPHLKINVSATGEVTWTQLDEAANPQGPVLGPPAFLPTSRGRLRAARVTPPLVGLIGRLRDDGTHAPAEGMRRAMSAEHVAVRFWNALWSRIQPHTDLEALDRLRKIVPPNRSTFTRYETLRSEPGLQEIVTASPLCGWHATTQVSDPAAMAEAWRADPSVAMLAQRFWGMQAPSFVRWLETTPLGVRSVPYTDSRDRHDLIGMVRSVAHQLEPADIDRVGAAGARHTFHVVAMERPSLLLTFCADPGRFDAALAPHLDSLRRPGATRRDTLTHLLDNTRRLDADRHGTPTPDGDVSEAADRLESDLIAAAWAMELWVYSTEGEKVDRAGYLDALEALAARAPALAARQLESTRPPGLVPPRPLLQRLLGHAPEEVRPFLFSLLGRSPTGRATPPRR